MARLRRRSTEEAASPKPPPVRRSHPGLLRRERRELLLYREHRITDLGGLAVELYRRDAWRDDLIYERCAEIVGIDARIAEIDALLRGDDTSITCSCGAALFASAHFCPNCGKRVDGIVESSSFENTMLAPPPFDEST